VGVAHEVRVEHDEKFLEREADKQQNIYVHDQKISEAEREVQAAKAAADLAARDKCAVETEKERLRQEREF